MKKYLLAFTMLILVSSAAFGAELTLNGAIEQAAKEIAGKLPKGTRIAIVSFESESDNVSDYIMEELTYWFTENNLEVVNRSILPYIRNVLNLQGKAELSDKDQQQIGQFVGAEAIITGQLVNTGNSYRFRVGVIQTKTATRLAGIQIDVSNNKDTNKTIAALQSNKLKARDNQYGTEKPPAKKNAGNWLDEGIKLASQSKFNEAINAFTEALKIDPNFSAAYLQRGTAIYASISQVADMNKDFDFGTVTSRRFAGDELEYVNRAIKDLSKAIRLNPTSTAYLQRGRVYNGKGDYDKAIEDFNQFIRLDPNNAGIYSNRGLAYTNKGDYDKAIEDFNKAISLDINDAYIYGNRGIAYDKKGNIDRAIEDYNQAIKLDPNDALAYNNRGNAYGKIGDYDNAIADYNHAIKLDPNYAGTYKNRGIIYFIKSDFNKAIADYSHAIRLDPNDAGTYYLRGNIYKNKEDYDRAIADYNQTIKLAPDEASAYNNRGEAYQEKWDFDKAIADYNEAIKLDPHYAAAYSNRAFAYLCIGDYERSIVDFNYVIRLNPNNFIAYFFRGLAYKAKGQTDLAVMDLETAISLNPNLQAARDEIEEISGW